MTHEGEGRRYGPPGESESSELAGKVVEFPFKVGDKVRIQRKSGAFEDWEIASDHPDAEGKVVVVKVRSDLSFSRRNQQEEPVAWSRKRVAVADLKRWNLI